MRGMPGDRRRFAVAYLCSILIHALALVLLAAFVLRTLAEGGAPESVVADTQITVRTETAAPVPSPPPVTARTPVPVLRPRVAALPVPARPQPRPAVTVPPKPPVPRELARIVPKATPQPTPPPPAIVAEVIPPAPVPTVRPTAVPTVRPTQEPTERPTVEPTERPTVEPTERPTVEPTVRPTVEPTRAPTATPATAPTLAPTAEPTVRPTLAPVARATVAPTAAATAVAERAAPGSGTVTAAVAEPRRSPAPARIAAAASPAPRPARTGRPAAAAPAPTSAGLASLNDRLRAALPTKPTAGMRRVDLGSGYSTNRVLDAYEAALAPPLAILAKTFGLIYTTRTVTHADSVAYVYERTHNVLLGHDVCRAYKITEHPLRPAFHPPLPVGPGVVTFPAPLRDVKPDIETVDVPCDARGMIKVEPGSIITPVPRHPPTPSPSSSRP